MPLNEVLGVRQSTALTYLAAARGRPNLTVRADSAVERVIMKGNSAAGVELASGQRIHGGSVVLCAGAIGSPRILLRSGIGPPADLMALDIPVRRDLPGVGRNLHDHPLLRIPFATRHRPSVPPRQTLLTARIHAGDAQPELQVLPSGPAQGDDGSTFTLLVAVLTPRSRGSLTLLDRDGRMRIDPGYLRDPADTVR